MLKRPELLAPVGRIESFYAAVENGANAIYVGGKQFSARQFAQNLDLDQLKEIVDYAKLRNIKVYITVNTLVKNKEMDELIAYLHELSLIGVDAIIIQDFGVARVARQYFPMLTLHASTQMSVHSQDGTQFLKDCGYERVVLSRELSLKEIKNITDKVDIEIECFVHGALCVSYSGQCLMSSIIGGRSGNRGRCAQPCRLPYTLTKDGVDMTDHESPYLMSPKDVETLDLIPQLIDAGIHTFKIEGRMKAPEYIASVARIYNKYINLALEGKGYQVAKEDQEELLTVFNRGGFTKGYFTQKPGKSMMALDSPKNMGLLIGEVTAYNKAGNVEIKTHKKLNPGDGIGIQTQGQNHVGVGISKEIQAGDVFKTMIKGRISIGDKVYLSKDHQLSKELANSYSRNIRKSLLSVKLKVKLGEPIQLDLDHENGSKVSILGEKVEGAKKAPITEEKLKSQISKFGTTPFQVSNISLESDPNVFVSISEINGLRREGVRALTKEILSQNQYDEKGYQRYIQREESRNHQYTDQKNFTASVRTIEQVKACLGLVSHIYLELENQSFSQIQEVITICHHHQVKLYIALPHIQREKDFKLYNELMDQIEKSKSDGYLIRTYGQFQRLMTSPKEKTIDYTLNVLNNENILHWESKQVHTVTLSVELSGDEIQEMTGKSLEMVVYGHIPIMTTDQCVLGRQGACPKEGRSPDGLYKLIDRMDEQYPLLTNCKICRMQILSSQPILLANQMSSIRRLPIHNIRFIFTNESPGRIKELISWYTDDTSQSQGDYTDRYFTQGVD